MDKLTKEFKKRLQSKQQFDIEDIVRKGKDGWEIIPYHWTQSVLYPDLYTAKAHRVIEKADKEFNKEMSRKLLTREASPGRDEIIYRRGFKEGLKTGLKVKNKLHLEL